MSVAASRPRIRTRLRGFTSWRRPPCLSVAALGAVLFLAASAQANAADTASALLRGATAATGRGVTLILAGSGDGVLGGGFGAHYRFTLRNASHDGAAATNVVLVDPLPPGATLLHISASQGHCSSDATLAGCRLGSLSPGAEATVDLHLRLPKNSCAVTNTATSDSDEPLTANSNPWVSVTVHGAHC